MIQKEFNQKKITAVCSALIKRASAVAKEVGYVEIQLKEINLSEDTFWASRLISQQYGERRLTVATYQGNEHIDPIGEKAYSKIEVSPFWDMIRISISYPDGGFIALAYDYEGKFQQCQSSGSDSLKKLISEAEKCQDLINEEIEGL